MDCVNCECTVKTMDNLDGAIRALLQRGKRVNKMMDKEKAIRAAKKREEVNELKKNLPKGKSVIASSTESDETDIESALGTISEEPTLVNSDCAKKRQIFNKKLKTAETVDFDIPSLAYESSVSNGRSLEIALKYFQTPFTSASVSIPKKTCSMYSRVTNSTERTTSVTSASTTTKSRRGEVILDEKYVVDRDGRSEILPLKVLLHQRRDGSLDVHFVFLDKNGKKTMNVSLNVHEKKVSNVKFEGKEVKPDV